MGILFTCQGWRGSIGLGKRCTKLGIRSVLRIPELSEGQIGFTLYPLCCLDQRGSFWLFLFSSYSVRTYEEQAFYVGPASWACSLFSCLVPHVYKGPNLGVMLCCHYLGILNAFLNERLFISISPWGFAIYILDLLPCL